MKWKIVTVGKPALPWAKAAMADYGERIARMASLEVIHLRDAGIQANEERMRQAGKGCHCIALDERGRQMRSVELARWIEARELAAARNVCILVGGSDGHTDALRAFANECWSLSKLTLQHELALVVLLEQIYRAHTIVRGEPYHRE